MLKRSSKPPRTNKRRRGSVLVIVVAVLTMIALIGTAYIATARLDRYSAQDGVATAKKETTNQQYIDEVEHLVRETIAADFDNPVTGFRSCAWLADRLPRKMSPHLPASNIPIWRYITGKLDPDMDNRRFEPPLLRPNGYDPIDAFLRLGLSANDDGSGRFAAVPASITLSYPSNYIVEKYRDKVRTFPALQFFNPGLRNLATEWDFVVNHGPRLIPNNDNPFVYLAADADGDGIADSVLFRVSTGAIQGVTYYAGVRIIDNNSAININTARTIGDAEYNASDVAFDPTGSTTGIGLRTFFPSSIGLRELFRVYPSVAGNMPIPGPALWAIDEYRFGYDPGATQGNSGVWEQKVPIPPVITDENVVGGTALNSMPPGLNYQFATRGEALSMQLARRIESPGYRATNVQLRFRAFDEANAAALAYRFCMDRIDPESSSIHSTLSPFEDRMFNAVANPNNLFLVDGVVRSASNYTNHPSNTFKTFPANAIDDWFSWLNYEADVYRSITALPNAVFIQNDTNAKRFRSVRPLLTAYNPVTNLIVVKDNPFRWPSVLPAYPVPPAKWPDVLYPGMPITDPNPLRLNGATVGIKPGDTVVRTQGNRTMEFMYMGRPGSSPSNDPFADALPAGHMAPTSWEPQPYVSGHAKTSINTAGFPELWRAFFMAMSGRLDPTTLADPNRSDWTPFDQEYWAMAATERNDPFWGNHIDTTNDRHPLRMFRSSLRYSSSALPPLGMLKRYQMMILRSALAAVNTISLRDRPLTGSGSTLVPTRDITLFHADTTAAGNPVLNPAAPYQVSVFGMVPQPFITEVYANSDKHSYGGGTHQNPYGYVAIELYNPYGGTGGPALNLKDWRLAIVRRSAGKLTLVAEHIFGATDEIPADGFLVLESFNSGAGSNYRPPSSQLPVKNPPAGVKTCYVSVLAQSNAVQAFGNEVILLRPRDPANLPASFQDMVPVDQFDFSGMGLTSTKTWHYARSSSNWEFIYPGRYDGRSAGGLHHPGIHSVSYTSSAYNETKTPAENKNALDPWNPKDKTDDPFQQYGTPPTLIPPISLGSANSSASYNNRCVIPWETVLKGPPAIAGGSTYQYPFGGFARNADILQVPFIGAYVIKDNMGDVVEMNSVSMDSAFAEDTNPNNNISEASAAIATDAAEQVGRFCPLPDAISYDWAGRLFDYMDVQVPADDYLPNMRSTPTAPIPKRVASHGQLDINANRGFDDLVPSQGKINILTAPPRVLSMLPLVPDASGLNFPYKTSWASDPGTENVARAIAKYRDDYWEGNDANHPEFPEAFRSILDLNKVPLVRKAAAVRAANAAGIKSKQGNYYGDTANSGFDERFLITNRVSNLITTRSDTFTVYIVVQGWREADTKLPCLEWEQRKAFIIDRSAGPDKLKIIPVPTD